MRLDVLVPLALGGEAVASNQTFLALLALGSIIGGWLLLAGLWYFVFRDRARSKADKQSVVEQQTVSADSDSPPLQLPNSEGV